MANVVRRVVTAGVFAVFLLSMAYAQQAPNPMRVITYQGKIATASGTALNGTHTVTITLYTDSGGHRPVWSGSYPEKMSDGIFSVALGSGAYPFPLDVDFSQPTWIGVKVDGLAEMQPYTQLTGSPYAISIPDNSITADKIAADYVGAITVNGKKITGNGTTLNLTNGENSWLTYDEKTGSLSMNSMGGNDNLPQTVGDKVLLGGNIFTDGTAGNEWIGSTSASTGSKELWFKTGSITTMRFIPPFGTGTVPNIIGGSSNNSITGTNTGGSMIAGGGSTANSIATTFSMIGSGNGNTILQTSDSSVIGGGGGNQIDDAPNSVVGGGRGNVITSQGFGNPPDEFTDWHTIGGGHNNQILIDIDKLSQNVWMGSSTISGGESNTLSAPWGVIGGGQNNVIAGQFPVVSDADFGDAMKWDVIGGGNNNQILGFSLNSTIGGGVANTIGGGASTRANPFHDMTIGGGNANSASNNAATVSGGWLNTASGNVSAIGGGDHNTASGEGSAIAGGTSNIASVQYSAIAGGNGNLAGRMTFVGGGFQNDATGILSGTPNIDHSTTIGGSQLATTGQNQAVLGWLNQKFGNNHLLTNGPNDDREFEIGSARFDGINWVRNNAFEVSYNGHSIVTQTNGSSIPFAGGQPSVFQGATYVESPVYAWGAVDASGAAIGNDNFGISQVIPLWPLYTPNSGTYLVTLAPADPHGGPIPDITNASVTVTVLNNLTSDFIAPPPLPPLPAMSPYMAPYSQPETISDSEVQALYGPPTIDRSALFATSKGAETPSQIATAETNCGYATASQIGITIMGTTYPRSFIVRTYYGIGGESPCYQASRALFFKVCHR